VGGAYCGEQKIDWIRAVIAKSASGEAISEMSLTMRLRCSLQSLAMTIGDIILKRRRVVMPETRFLQIVLPGDTLIYHGKVSDKKMEGDKKYVMVDVFAENQRGEKVMVANARVSF